jgi:hypothetical protein
MVVVEPGLDRLASVRLVAQIGAAIGREFSYALLRAVSRLSEDELQAALARLVASELVFQRGTPPEAVYSFKHALVQDAAHASMLRSTRQQLHAQIAAALETHSPELMETQPELFAQHYAEAGLVAHSVASWSKAGRRSVIRSALAEAAAQFQKGLDQLALLPDDRERQQRELEIRTASATLLSPRPLATRWKLRGRGDQPSMAGAPAPALRGIDVGVNGAADWCLPTFVPAWPRSSRQKPHSMLRQIPGWFADLHADEMSSPSASGTGLLE